MSGLVNPHCMWRRESRCMREVEAAWVSQEVGRALGAVDDMIVRVKCEGAPETSEMRGRTAILVE